MLKYLPAMWETQVQSLSWEASPGEGNGNPLQYSCLENPMDSGAWWVTVHGIAKDWTWLSEYTLILALQVYSLPTELPGKPKQYICIFILRWRKELTKDKSPENPKLNSGNNFSCVCAYSVTQSCPTLCDPMDLSPPGSSVRGILQARILEWVAISFSRRSSPPKDWTCVSGIGRQILYHWATWEVPFLLPWAYNLIACTLANRKVEELAYIGSFFLVNKALLASQLVSPLSSTPPPIPPTCCA